MPTDEVRIKSLYVGLYRTIIRFGLLIAAAWLFAVFSYYLSRTTGADWLARSGAVMSLVGAAVTFRLVHFYQGALATALKEGLVSLPREIELRLRPPKSYQLLSYLGYLTGVVGTGVGATGICCCGWSPEPVSPFSAGARPARGRQAVQARGRLAQPR